MISFIPNFITSLRLLLAIPISISIYQGNEVLALILFVIAGVSDSLDGFLARKFNWESKFGQLLDPLADKCLILSTMLALAFASKLPIWLIAILLVRDAIIVMGAMLYIMLFEGRNALSNRWGKHYTGWIVALFILALLQDMVVPWESFFYLLLQISKLGVLMFTSLSLFSYLVDPGREISQQLFSK
tara:strand:- start:1033 stop:1593 length:561 start_codon:yes stop_codon:yes gene_type:complete